MVYSSSNRGYLSRLNGLVIFDTTTKKTQRRWKSRKRNGNTIKYKDRGKRGKGSQTHLWVMGLLITESGTRIPLPRRSYYTKAYAKRYGLKYRSQVDLVVEMLSELSVPENVELYELRWEIELYFKELKSHLHFTDYSFEDFQASEHWVDIVLITFLFLEYRRLQLLRGSLSPKEAYHLQNARTPQMMEVVKAEVNKENMLYIQEALKSSYGRKHLMKVLSKINLVA